MLVDDSARHPEAESFALLWSGGYEGLEEPIEHSVGDGPAIGNGELNLSASGIPRSRANTN
jgi:hypothetical protein